MDEEEEALRMFAGTKCLKTKRERQNPCQHYESRHIHSDEDRKVWLCLDCSFEWKQ